MTSIRKFLPYLAIFLAFSTLTFAVQPDRISGEINSSQMVSLANHISPMILSGDDRGLIDPSQQLHITIMFTPTAAQQLQLQTLLAEQQDHHSPSFHKWLTPESYADRFGLSRNDMAKIASWLQSSGFKVVYTARGRNFITFTGDAALAQNVFRTEIHRYEANGKTHFGNVSSPMVPAALSGIVVGFRGLHNFFPRPMIRPHANYTDSNFSTHFLAPGDIAKIYDINPLYTGSPVIDGTGQKMVVVGQSDVYMADINDFRTGFGFPTISGCTTNSSGVITACNATNFQLVIPTTGGDPGVNSGDLGESDLDIEWAGSVARNAKIIFVTSGGGVDDSASWAIDNHLAPVISMSYGLCEAFVTASQIAGAEVEYQKAAGLGISFFASSGDSGAGICDAVTPNPTAQLGISVSYPASSPSVTGVGGTEFNEGSGTFWNSTNGTNGVSAKSYIPEIAWNDTVIAGVADATGGGSSNCAFGTGTTGVKIGLNTFAFELCKAAPTGGFPKPAFQTALTPADGVRDVPDISFSASNANDPYIVCTPQSELFNTTSTTSSCVNGIAGALDDFTFPSAFGGTSASAPVAAGVAVLLNQFLGGTGLGNMNPQIYALYGSNPEAFHDILAGFNSFTLGTSDNIVPCVATTPTFEPSTIQCPAGGSFGFTAGPGYDLVTGLGSLDVSAFANAWAATLSGFSLQATPSTVGVIAGHSVDSSIALTPLNGFNSAVTYTCTGTGVTCTFTPSGATTTNPVIAHIQTTPNMATGSVPVTVKGTAGSVSATTIVTLTVAATDQSFTLGPSDASITVTAGSSGNTGLTLTGVNGFNAAVTYSCAMPAALTEATCSVTAPTSTTATVTVGTRAAVAQLRSHNRQIWYAALLPGLLGIFFAAGSKRTPRGLRMLSLMVVLGLSTLWMGACGGGNSGGGGPPPDPGTPKGNYTLTINGTTGGTNPVTGTTTVALTVN